MRTIALFTIGLFFNTFGFSQTAEEIVDNYLTSIGGNEKLSQVETVKMISTVKAQGMEMPAELLKKAPNKMKMTLTFQGNEIVQPSFNGEEGWSTNFMSMENEKMDAEAAAAIQSEAQDFPDVFYDYATKGYILKLEGEEEIDGVKYHVVHLTKSPINLGGEEIKNEAKYYFDQATNLLVFKKGKSESGPTAGMEMESVYRDYKEVDGIMFPYAVDQKVNGMVQASLEVEAVEINAEIEDSTFDFPE